MRSRVNHTILPEAIERKIVVMASEFVRIVLSSGEWRRSERRYVDHDVIPRHNVGSGTGTVDTDLRMFMGRLLTASTAFHPTSPGMKEFYTPFLGQNPIATISEWCRGLWKAYLLTTSTHSATRHQRSRGRLNLQGPHI